MKLAFLWSDYLVFILVACVLIFFIKAGRDRRTSECWKKVFSSRVGLCSFVVMIFYLLVALLDSVHFREPLQATEASSEVHYSSEVLSVLDLVLSEMKDTPEKTYSAPFAIFSFAKENMKDEQGRVYRDYPRLLHGGVHLESAENRQQDILLRSVHAIGLGLFFSAVFIFLIGLVRKRYGGMNYVPWVAAYIVISVLVVFFTWVVQLGGYYHIMGTDKVGTDVMYQSIKAIRTGVLIGCLAVVMTLPLALFLGISAGYFKGVVDDVIQYIYTTLNSIPGILLIMASVLLLDTYIDLHEESFDLIAVRADFKFLALCFILGLTSWTGLCRLLRAETLKISQLDYVQAAHAFGVSHFKVITKHIMPNVMHLVLIIMVLDFSGFVMAEAVLSYLGVGVDSSMSSWGNMINMARSELSREPVVWWSVVSAFVFMFVLVLAANLLSDVVREAFDPRIVQRADQSVGQEGASS